MYSFIKLVENGEDVFRVARIIKMDDRPCYVYTCDGCNFTSCATDPSQTGTFYTESGEVLDLNELECVPLGSYGYLTKPTIGRCQYCGCKTVCVGNKKNFICLECKRARADLMDDTVGLRSYTFKPQPMFNDLDHRKTHLHMGFELEFDQAWFLEHKPYDDEYDEDDDDNGGDVLGVNNAVYKVCHTLNRDEPVVYCKGDGSLTHGAEIVSLPMTYDKLVEKRDDFKALFKSLLTEGWRSEAGGNCGFHIHCDKEFLGDDPNYKVAKLALLFARWDKELTAISRRRHFGYCRKDITINDPFSAMVGKVVNCDDRYVAINNQNSGTVEIRLWRGTLNIDTFYATLDLTQALVTMAKKFSVNTLQKLSFESVYKFMKDDENIAKIKQLVAKKDNGKENENDEEE